MKATCKKSLALALSFIIPIMVFSGPVQAATFCVSNEVELQTALTAAQGNVDNDLIQIVQGTYNGNFTYASTEANSLTIEGGYTSGCASRVIDPANTILDGGGVDNVLALVRQTGAAEFSVEGLTFQNGNATTVDSGGGLYAKTDGNATLTNNTFTGNSTAFGHGGGAWVNSGTLTNNTFTGNSTAPGNGGGACIYSTGTLTNNTFTGNSTAPGNGGGASVGGDLGYVGDGDTLTNNTFIKNSARYGGGVHITSDGPSTVTLTNNTISENTAEIQGGGIYIFFPF